ncbi:MAG TPA: class I SAM-dependent methyltransferase [Gammaproteobacteria bacterium]|nr:class I SAM-dependent methyltransferase [Gammaproteobacteria bacterium]
MNSQRLSGFNTAHKFRVTAFKLTRLFKQNFTCPICDYRGPFRDLVPESGKRLHAQCPDCRALERHRLQYLVISKIFADLDTGRLRMLHFAPENFLKGVLQGRFGSYETADIAMHGVDHHVDLQALPFAAHSYDVVFASHVLEHIPEDRKAIAEIRRILAPGGMAILPVPLVGPKTIEYPEANPHESMHMRAPGPDYFERYKIIFDRVELFKSDDFPEQYQLFNYEDRTQYPTRQSPYRVAVQGAKHVDYVPVCHIDK